MLVVTPNPTIGSLSSCQYEVVQAIRVGNTEKDQIVEYVKNSLGGNSSGIGRSIAALIRKGVIQEK